MVARSGLFRSQGLDLTQKPISEMRFSTGLLPAQQPLTSRWGLPANGMQIFWRMNNSTDAGAVGLKQNQLGGFPMIGVSLALQNGAMSRQSPRLKVANGRRAPCQAQRRTRPYPIPSKVFAAG